MDAARVSARHPGWAWLLALVAMAAFTAAGCWQLSRMHQKQAMLAEAAKALDHARAQPLLLASDGKRAHAYDWSTGSGRLANLTVWLDNQQHQGRVGVRMYCVLLPDDGVQAVLVDAGWWPLPPDRTLPVFGCPARAQQAVRGMLAAPPAPGIATGEPLTAQGTGRWLAVRLDLPAIAQALHLSTGIAPRVLRLDTQRQPDDAGVMLAPGERDLDILPNTLTPERHLGYAVQWFGLALAVLVVAIVLGMRRRRRQ